MLRRLVVALAAALSVVASCSVEDVDLTGKRCPCDDGWTCDVSENVCVRGTAPDASSDTGGFGGSGGVGGDGSAGLDGSPDAGGTGNCTSVEKLCNGVCVSTSNPLFGCGTVGCDACPDPLNGNAACSAGSCSLGTCDVGWDDCNDLPSDGCEFEAKDDLNCGACNKTCSLTNASLTSCNGGVCAPVCNASFLDCSSPSGDTPDDGCETSPDTDNRCGSCSNNCGSQGAAGGFKCLSGVCGCTQTAQCLLSGAANGNCNTTDRLCVCSGVQCKAGEACEKQGGSSKCTCNGGSGCTTGQTCCAGSGCTALASDSQNCGACGRACATGQSCVGGTCI